MKNNKGFAPILIVLIAVTVLAAAVACTQEAKLCPDGSAVGRTGPNCEFAACPSPAKKETVDCNNDLGCLAKESENCNPSKVVNNNATDLFGVRQTTTSFFEIKGMELNKCVFYIRTEKIDLIFPPAVSQEIVNQQKEIYKKLEGRDGTCKFITGDLTAMLVRWENGHLSSDDFKTAECNGKYFDKSL